MTPQDAIKFAEQQEGLTVKEREKVLALALMRVAKNCIELAVLWEFSVMVARGCGHEIGPLDFEFVIAINKNPASFLNYR